MKIAHLADIHIGSRAGSSAEYRHVFDNLIPLIPADAIVVICGDIFHNKTYYGANDIADFKYLLTALSQWETIIIPGNHDLNMSNMNDLDLISPLIDQFPHVTYSKTSEPISVRGVQFYHMMVTDKLRAIPDNPGKYILLYHGGVEECDVSTFMHDVLPVSIYSQFRATMLGDIHKHQIMGMTQDQTAESAAGRPIRSIAAYPGSLIQQNHGEDPVKGFVLWDENLIPTFIPVPAPVRFCTFDLCGDLTEDRIIEACSRPRNHDDKTTPRLVIDCSKDAANRMIDLFRKTYGNVPITIKKVAPERKINTKRVNIKEVLTNYLEKIIISPNQSTSAIPIDIRALVLELHEKYSESQKFSQWSIKCLEWEDFYKYGKCNKIDFTKIKGLAGIIAPNHSGKSSVFDLIAYALFNHIIRGDVHSIVREGEKTARFKIIFTVNDDTYLVERVILPSGKTPYKFVRLTSQGEQDMAAGCTNVKEMYVEIRKLIGSYEDFANSSLYNDSETLLSDGLYSTLKPLLGFVDDNINKKLLAENKILKAGLINPSKQISNRINDVMSKYKYHRENFERITNNVENIKTSIADHLDRLTRIREMHADAKATFASMKDPHAIGETIAGLMRMLTHIESQIMSLGAFDEIQWAKEAYATDSDYQLSSESTLPSAQLQSSLYNLAAQIREEPDPTDSIISLEKRIEEIPAIADLPRMDSQKYMEEYQQLTELMAESTPTTVTIPVAEPFDELISIHSSQLTEVDFSESDYILAKHAFDMQTAIIMPEFDNNEITMISTELDALRNQLAEVQAATNHQCIDDKSCDEYSEQINTLKDQIRNTPVLDTLQPITETDLPSEESINYLRSQIQPTTYDHDDYIELTKQYLVLQSAIVPVKDFSKLDELIAQSRDYRPIDLIYQDINTIPIRQKAATLDGDIARLTAAIKSHTQRMRFSESCEACDYNKQKHQVELAAMEAELAATVEKNNAIIFNNDMIDLYTQDDNNKKNLLEAELKQSLFQDKLANEIALLRPHQDNYKKNLQTYLRIDIVRKKLDQLEKQKAILDANALHQTKIAQLSQSRSAGIEQMQLYKSNEENKTQRSQLYQRLNDVIAQYTTAKQMKELRAKINLLSDQLREKTAIRDNIVNHNRELIAAKLVFDELSAKRILFHEQIALRNTIAEIKKNHAEYLQAIDAYNSNEIRRENYNRLYETREALRHRYEAFCKNNELINLRSELAQKLSDLYEQKKQFELQCEIRAKHAEISDAYSHAVIVEQAKQRVAEAIQYQNFLKLRERNQLLAQKQSVQRDIDESNAIMEKSVNYETIRDDIVSMEEQSQLLEHNIQDLNYSLGVSSNELEISRSNVDRYKKYIDDNLLILARMEALRLYKQFLNSADLKDMYDEYIDNIFARVNINLANMTNLTIKYKKAIVVPSSSKVPVESKTDAAVAQAAIEKDVTYKLILSLNDKSVSNDNDIPLKLCSSFQKFVTAIALRVALSESLMHSSRFLLIDEGFGSIDQENMPKVIDFLNMIKTSYDYIMIISHQMELQNRVEYPLMISFRTIDSRKYSHINNADNTDIIFTPLSMMKTNKTKKQLTSESTNNIDASAESANGGINNGTDATESTNSVNRVKTAQANVIRCVCGANIKKKSLQTHLATAKHKRFLTTAANK